jgi:hypothetical protein
MTKLKQYESNSDIRCSIYEAFILKNNLTDAFDKYIEPKYVYKEEVNHNQLNLFPELNLNFGKKE